MLNAAAFLPDRASAFWPFSSNVDAAMNISMPGSSTPALHASINIDPNPDKGLADILQTTGGRALLASSGPEGTITDVASSLPPGRISVHEVSNGETLSDIADMFNVSINTIIWANNLSGPKDIHPGDILIILPVSGIERIVVRGDTLKSLAKKYGGDANEIAQFNGLDLNTPLAIGSKIIIPGAEIVPVQPKASTASVKRSGREPYLGGSGAVQNGYFVNPIPGAVLTQTIHGWNAVDLGAARGTPIHAAAGGTVIIARGSGWNGGYGSYLVISHDNGSQTLYSHMKSVTASAGQSVFAGQIIGYVGSTGLSTGPHLHFETRNIANPFRDCSVGSVCAPR